MRPADRFAWIIGCVLLAAASGTATAQDADPAGAEALREAAEALGAAARQAQEPPAPGERRVLQAVVMKVEGRAQWRADEQSPWKAAAVDDLLSPGAIIRTGRASQVVLRVGHNATVLVDRNSRVILPEIVRTDDTLRTAVELRRGRADFKVDRVGPINDFTVMTPSTTLAVRGTAYGVEYGGFEGTQVVAASANRLFAIEVRYFLALYSYYLSGGGTTSDRHQNPVVAALFRTIGPPPVMSALVEDPSTPDLLVAGVAADNPVKSARRVDLQLTSVRDTLALGIFEAREPDPQEPEPFVLPVFRLGDFQFGEYGTQAEIAAFLCDKLVAITGRWRELLLDDGLGAGGITQARQELQNICNAAGGQLTGEHMVEMFGIVLEYCRDRHGDHPDHYATCVLDFVEAFNDVNNLPPGIGRHGRR